MYYYIMESADKKGLLWQEKIKNTLGDLGIAGETVTPTPARTIEELTHLGIIKGYSTIVAVGSEKLINTVATTIIDHKEAADVVLGVIPEDSSSLIAKKVGVISDNNACQTLKFRKLDTFDVALIEPNHYFITEAEIISAKTVQAYLSTPNIKALVSFNKITIRPGLEIEIHDDSGKNQGGKFFGWLMGSGKKKEKDIYFSYITAKKMKIEAINTILAAKVQNEVIAKTPIVCVTRDKALKIIVARDTIETKNE